MSIHTTRFPASALLSQSARHPGKVALLVIVVSLASSAFTVRRAARPAYTASFFTVAGPPGEINVVACGVADANRIFAGDRTGFYFSRDRGITWQQGNAGLPVDPDVIAIEPDPASPNVIFAALANKGLYRSADGGVSWEPLRIGLPERLTIRTIRVDRLDNKYILVGTYLNGLFSSYDGGLSWSEVKMFSTQPRLSVSSIAFLDSPGHVVIGTNYRHSSAIFVSDDQGRTWAKRGDSLPAGDITSLAYDARSKTLYAGLERAGLYYSRDRGRSWRIVPGISPDMDVQDAEIVTHGIVLSTPRDLWIVSSDKPAPIGTSAQLHDIKSIAAPPLEGPLSLFVATRVGLFAVRGDGNIVHPLTRGLSANNSVRALVATERQLFAANRNATIFAFDKRALTWTEFGTGLPRPIDVRVLFVDNEPDHNVLYAGTVRSGLFRRDLHHESAWTQVTGLPSDASVRAMVKWRHTLLVGTACDGLYISTDAGRTWKNRGALRSIESLAITTNSLLYAGTKGSGLHVSEDLGQSWKPDTALPSTGDVAALTVSRGTGDIYIAIAGAGIYTKTPIDSRWRHSPAFPMDVTIWCVAVDDSKEHVFVGTSSGLYYSVDQGVTWASVAHLPAFAQIRVIATDKDEVYVGTSLRDSFEGFGLLGTRLVFQLGETMRQNTGLFALIAVQFLATIACVTFLFTRARFHRIDEYRQRSVKQWHARIDDSLVSGSSIYANDLSFIPERDRRFAIKSYVEAHPDYDVLVSPGGAGLTHRYADKLTDMQRLWAHLAADVRSGDGGAFERHTNEIIALLDSVIGLTVVSRRRLGSMTSYSVRAPIIRLRLPPEFPIIFVQGVSVTEHDAMDLRDLVTMSDVRFAVVLVVSADSSDQTAFARRLREVYALDIVVLGHNDIRDVILRKRRIPALVHHVLKQIDLVTLSPFSTEGPVPDNMFVGRERELKELASILERSNVAIMGAHRIGKTSTLRRLAIGLRSARWSVCYLDCQPATTYSDLFRLMQLEWNVPHVDSSQTPLDFLAVLNHLRAREGERIVMMFDEIDSMFRFDSENGWHLLKVLASAFHAGKCQFVFCGVKGLFDQHRDRDSPLFRMGQAYTLGLLRERDVESLVMEPFGTLGIAVENQRRVVDRIQSVSAGHPTLVQFVCAALIRLLDTNRERIVTPSRVEAIVHDVEFVRFVHGTILGGLTELERRVASLIPLGGLSESKVISTTKRVVSEVTDAEIEKALDHLTLYSVVHRTDGRSVQWSNRFLGSLVTKQLVTRDISA